MTKWVSPELATYLGELSEVPEFQPPHYATVGMLEYLDTAAESDVADNLGDWLYQAFPGELDRRMAGLLVIYWRKIKEGRK